MDNNHQDFDKEKIQDTKKIPDLEQNELYSKTPNMQQQNDTSLEELKQSYQAPSQEPQKRKLTKGRIAVNIIVAILSVILIVAGAGCFYVDGMLNKILLRTRNRKQPQVSQSVKREKPQACLTLCL